MGGGAVKDYITAVRLTIVWLYAWLGLALAGGGVSLGELTAMFVTGVVAFVVIVSADWVAAAMNRDGDE